MSSWDDITENTNAKSTKSVSKISIRKSKVKNYQINSPKGLQRQHSSPFFSSNDVGTVSDECQSLTSRSTKTTRVDLLNDHRSDQRTSSVLRKKQLSSEFHALKSSVEKSYKSYRTKKKLDVLTMRYLQWISWFKKRYSTDPTTKLTKREFEKLWCWFGQLSNPINDEKENKGNQNGIQLEVIVNAFIEYGVFDNRQNAMNLLRTIDTDRSQTITFLEFMEGINSGNLSQTLQLRCFVSSLVNQRIKGSSQDGKNVLGVFSNAVLKTRLRRVSTSTQLKSNSNDRGDDFSSVDEYDNFKEMGVIQEDKPLHSQSTGGGGGGEEGEGEGSPHSNSKTINSFPLQKPSSSPSPSFSTSHPHPLASRLRGITSKFSNSNRVYAADGNN